MILIRVVPSFAAGVQNGKLSFFQPIISLKFLDDMIADNKRGRQCQEFRDSPQVRSFLCFLLCFF